MRQNLKRKGETGDESIPRANYKMLIFFIFLPLILLQVYRNMRTDGI